MINEMIKQNNGAQGLLTMTLKESLGTKRMENGTSSFKDVFGGAVSKENVKTSSDSIAKKDYATAPSDSRDDKRTENKISSYRELQRRIRSEIRKNLVHTPKNLSDSENAEDNKPDKLDGTDKAAYNEAIMNCFAKLTGLKPEEFKAVLEKAGVSAEELSSLTDMQGIAEKIAGVTGLNGDQQDMMAKLMKLAADKINSALNPGEFHELPVEEGSDWQTINSKVKTNEDPGKIKVTLQAAVPTENATEQAQMMFQSVLAKLRLKLDELGKKLESNEGSEMQEINASLDGLLDSMKETLNASGMAAAGDATKTGEESVLQNGAKDQNYFQLVKDAENKKGSTETEAVDTVVKPTAETVAATASSTDTTAVNPLNIVQTQTNGADAIIQKVDAKTPIQPKEIINQVIEKAKIVITPDKSEMVMDLKPESLGKLSLKVVTEQGIVMAKFVAENEQVKQILESNMQLLKDSLEKQGMNVQGFSVSVRQDGNYSSGRWNNEETQRNSLQDRKGSGIRSVGIAAAAVEMPVNLTRNNPYNWSSSTVNFTA